MKTYLLVAVILLLTQCQGAKELHYFKKGDNYFRLKVREYSIFSSSRYLSGYYDENAVDNYFGEISRPDSFKVYKAYSTARLSKESPGFYDNKKLVLLLSTKSEAVSNSISNIAENEKTLQIMAKIMNKDKVNETRELKNLISRIYSIHDALINYGKKLSIGDTSKKSDISSGKLDAFINELKRVRTEIK